MANLSDQFNWRFIYIRPLFFIISNWIQTVCVMICSDVGWAAARNRTALRENERDETIIIISRPNIKCALLNDRFHRTTTKQTKCFPWPCCLANLMHLRRDDNVWKRSKQSDYVRRSISLFCRWKWAIFFYINQMIDYDWSEDAMVSVSTNALATCTRFPFSNHSISNVKQRTTNRIIKSLTFASTFGPLSMAYIIASDSLMLRSLIVSSIPYSVIIEWCHNFSRASATFVHGPSKSPTYCARHPLQAKSNTKRNEK